MDAAQVSAVKAVFEIVNRISPEMFKIAADAKVTAAQVAASSGQMSGAFVTAAASAQQFAADHRASFMAVGQAAGLVVAAVGAAGAAVVALGLRGADVDDVTGAFDRLSATAPGALEALQKGVGGLLTNFELMKPLNAAMSAGFQLNAVDAYTMSRAAWVLADAQGGDLKESYDKIAQAMATGKVAALGALGLNIELKGASAALKTALAAEGEAITSNAQKQANRQAAMEAMNRVVLAAGDQSLDFGEKLTRLKVQIGNVTDSLSVAVATSPVLGAAMTSVGDALQSAFGANQTQTIQTLVGAIGQVAIIAVKSATYVVSAAQTIAETYYSARAAVSTFFESFNNREISRVEGLVKTYEAIAATSTSATSASKLRLQELRIELAGLKGYSDGLNRDANESLANQARLTAAGKDAQKFLDELIRSMQKAATQQASATSVAKALADAHVGLATHVGAAARATAEHTQVLSLWDKAQAHRAAALQMEGDAWEEWEKTVSKALAAVATNPVLLKTRDLSGIVPQVVAPAVAAIVRLTATVLEQVDQVGFALQRMGGSFGGFVGSTISGLGTMVSAWANAKKAALEYHGAATNAQKAAAVMGGVAGVAGATSSGSTAGRTVSGAAAGAAAGLAIGVALAPATMGLSLLLPVVGAIGGALVGLFRGMSASAKEAKAANEEISKLRGTLAGTYGSLENAAAMATRFGLSLTLTARGKDGLAQLKAEAERLDAVMKALAADVEKYGLTWKDIADPAQRLRASNEAAQTLYASFDRMLRAGYDTSAIVRGMTGDINGWLSSALTAGTKIPPGMQPIIEQLITMGLLTEENARLMLGLAADTMPSLASIKEAADRYGLTLDQLGPKVKQLQINETVAQIVADWQVLSASTDNVGLLFEKMGPKVQGLVNDALKFGLELPESLKPLLQKLADAGLLTDENGQKLKDLSGLDFAEPLAKKVDELITKLGELIDTITNGVGGALERVGQMHVRPRIAPEYEEPSGDRPQDSSHTPGFAGGTQGRYLDFGMGTQVTLHGRERVMTEAEGRSSSGDGRSVVIDATFISQLDGMEVARNQVRYGPIALAEAGL